MSKDDKRPFLLNRMWNMKAEQAQAHIVELQALLKYLGLENLKKRPETRNVDDILESIFVQVYGRKKAM